MIRADAFLAPARAQGVDFYTGVPCSYLTPLINRVISDPALRYVGASSEGEAVAIAAGAWLAGRTTVVMCQNSGLGNAVNPLTSLNHPFRIPTMLIVTWRGQPGLKDEPQHDVMGEISAGLLDTIRVPHVPFPREDSEIAAALEGAVSRMSETDLPTAFIMEKGSVADERLDEQGKAPPVSGTLVNFCDDKEKPSRISILKHFVDVASDQAAVVATTGKCGRELFTLADREQHLYQVGSMGCASGMALGIALNVTRPVIVLDGDGAMLMKMGTLATIGAYAPDNLLHIVLDNGVHDSTGGQATVSASVDFAAVAQACGYRWTAKCDSLAGFERAFAAAQAESGPKLIHARILPGSIDGLGRPTISPAEVARRFKAFLES